MRPPSPHSKFFSSLKQVEKRQKLKTPTHPFNSSPAPANIQTNNTSTESLGTPMFIHSEIEPKSHSSTLHESSEPPIAFLSSSPQFPPIHQTLDQDKEQHNPTPIEAKISGIDEIDMLIQLLGLSNLGRDEENGEEVAGFYEKIVGVKGPKSGKERRRLDGWIRYFSQSAAVDGGDGTTGTLSLGYLLLGKAACELENGESHGFGGLDFPSAIEEFLKNDPPSK